MIAKYDNFKPLRVDKHEEVKNNGQYDEREWEKHLIAAYAYIAVP